MAKARAGLSRAPMAWASTSLFNGIGGPEYIVSILTGYTGEEKEEAGDDLLREPRLPRRLDRDAAAAVGRVR